uniref:Uncharacterized protein n=1 Tax=Ixodes ricinus TaxID=34613 RepID=A0A6B0UVS1_IXORI
MSSPCSQTLCPLGCCCSPLLASLPPPLPHSPRPSCPIPRGLRLQERSRAPRRPLSSCLLVRCYERPRLPLPGLPPPAAARAAAALAAAASPAPADLLRPARLSCGAPTRRRPPSSPGWPAPAPRQSPPPRCPPRCSTRCRSRSPSARRVR